MINKLNQSVLLEGGTIYDPYNNKKIKGSILIQNGLITKAGEINPITADFFRGTILSILSRPFLEYPLLIKSGDLSISTHDDYLKRWYKHSFTIIDKMLFK